MRSMQGRVEQELGLRMGAQGVARQRSSGFITGGHGWSPAVTVEGEKTAHLGRSISFDKTSLHNYGALIDSVHNTKNSNNSKNSNSISYSHSMRLLPIQPDGRACNACALRTWPSFLSHELGQELRPVDAAASYTGGQWKSPQHLCYDVLKLFH